MSRTPSSRDSQSKQARDLRTDNGRRVKGGDKKAGKFDQSVINGFFRMGSHSHCVKMSGKKLKSLGDAQKKKKQSEITRKMTSKFLRRLRVSHSPLCVIIYFCTQLIFYLCFITSVK